MSFGCDQSGHQNSAMFFKIFNSGHPTQIVVIWYVCGDLDSPSSLQAIHMHGFVKHVCHVTLNVHGGCELTRGRYKCVR